jgi:hypothetical protein
LGQPAPFANRDQIEARCGACFIVFRFCNIPLWAMLAASAEIAALV